MSANKNNINLKWLTSDQEDSLFPHTACKFRHLHFFPLREPEFDSGVLYPSVLDQQSSCHVIIEAGFSALHFLGHATMASRTCDNFEDQQPIFDYMLNARVYETNSFDDRLVHNDGGVSKSKKTESRRAKPNGQKRKEKEIAAAVRRLEEDMDMITDPVLLYDARTYQRGRLDRF